MNTLESESNRDYVKMVIKKISMILIIIMLSTILNAQGTAGFQEYYIPGPEDDLSNIWDYVNPTSFDDNYKTVVSVTATSDNTEIIYDHWEDGYGDSQSSNETITLQAGEYHAFIDNTIGTDDDDDSGDGNEDPAFTAGNASTYNYDGGDRIYVIGGPVFVLRASLPHDYMSVCLELLPTEAWRGDETGIDFIMPFGIDLYASDSDVFHDFMRVAIVIQSASDANTVVVDCPSNINDWTGDLDRGETKYFTDVRMNTTISCDSKAQIHMILGSSLNYDIRGLSGIPTFSGDGNNYWSPISVSKNADMFLYNHNASSITINYESGSTGSFTIPAKETVSYYDKTGNWANTGVHVYTSGDEFCAIMSVDTRKGTYDWACGLTQNSLLGTDYRIGWAPGGSYAIPTRIDNCVFAIATEDNTVIYADFDTDGTTDKYYSLNKLDVVLIADESDHNTSGARIWSNDKKIALSYGEISGTNSFEGGNTPSGSPAMDLGYGILPMPEEWITPVIQVSISDDQGETPIVHADEDVDFTIRLDAHDYEVTNVDLGSILDVGWEFTTNSAVITHYNSSSVAIWSSSGVDANPTIETKSSGDILTWDISRTVASDEYIILTYQAHPTTNSLEGENEIVSETVGTYSAHEFNSYDSEFITLGNDGENNDFGDDPLPVNLIVFSATQKNNQVILEWQTGSEQENLGYILERKDNENKYVEIASYSTDDELKGQGNTSVRSSYEFTDANVVSGVTYTYHISDVDYSGNITKLKTEKITVTENATDIPQNYILSSAYPNPFNNATTILFKLPKTTFVKLNVYDINGNLVDNIINEYKSAGSYSIKWDAINISSGIYFYRIEAGNFVDTKKLVLLK